MCTLAGPNLLKLEAPLEPKATAGTVLRADKMEDMQTQTGKTVKGKADKHYFTEQQQVLLDCKECDNETAN